jgi:hypothetical protein
LGGCLAVAVALAGPAGVPNPSAALGREAGFTDAEWSALETRRIVAKVVETAERSEVLSLAALTVQASSSRFLDCARDPTCLRSGGDLIQLGRFQTTPSTVDLQALSLDTRDLEHLRSCRVGSCLVRLTAANIGRFNREVDWDSPLHPTQAERLFREVLAAHAAGYMVGGNQALPEYRDKKIPVPVGARLVGLLRQPNWVFDRVPELRQYLEEFPRADPATAEGFLHWSKEKFWRKTVVAMNHVTIYEKVDPTWRFAFVASKQLYASHYQEAALELMVFATNAGTGRSYLLFLGHTRADVRPGGFNWLERRLLQRLVRRRLESRFEAMRDRLEGASRSTGPARAQSAAGGSGSHGP